jgi:hypothetical protein
MKTYEPILLAEPVDCAAPRCKELTLWRKPRQSKHGMCLDHMVGARPLSPAGMSLVRKIVLTAFPRAVISVPELLARSPWDGSTVRAVVTGTWVRLGVRWRLTVDLMPPDVGPCTLCRRLVRRHYGPDGSPLCDECRVVARIAAAYDVPFDLVRRRSA